jgi:hypothetical protein
MSDEDNNEPRRVRFYRLVPQLKIFKQGTVLKTKQDLYYSFEEDVVETGGQDNWSPLISALGGPPGTNPPAPGSHGVGSSFSQSGDFLHKESTVMFVEAAQFRADDNRIYIRAHLLSNDKIVWVNIARVPQRQWGYMIRKQQKELIQNEIEKMFEVLIS